MQKMQLRYATVTGVCRDDLPDEGAWLYAETIRQIHALNPQTGVEMLAPDFSGNLSYLGQLFDAAPEVFAHNVETVPGSSSASDPDSATSGHWTCCAPPGPPVW